MPRDAAYELTDAEKRDLMHMKAIQVVHPLYRTERERTN